MKTHKPREYPTVWRYNKFQLVETLSLKNTFSTFQYPSYLECKPFPLPPPLSPFQCWLFKFPPFFVLLETLIRGGGRGAAVWEIIGKLITPQEGEVSPLFLQLVVAIGKREQGGRITEKYEWSEAGKRNKDKESYY